LHVPPSGRITSSLLLDSSSSLLELSGSDELLSSTLLELSGADELLSSTLLELSSLTLDDNESAGADELRESVTELDDLIDKELDDNTLSFTEELETTVSSSTGSFLEIGLSRNAWVIWDSHSLLPLHCSRASITSAAVKLPYRSSAKWSLSSALSTTPSPQAQNKRTAHKDKRLYNRFLRI